MDSFTIEALAHVGTLDLDDQKSRSHEGKLLSVCYRSHTEDWREIARLNGSPVWTAEGPFELVDVHGVDPPYEWAHSLGLVEKAMVHEVKSWGEFPQVTRFTDRERANEEFSFRLSDGEGVTIRKRKRWQGTEKLRQRHSLLSMPVGKYPETAVRIEHVFDQDLDGLWWDDWYAPSRLSCPRGGLNPKHVPAFNRVQM